MLPHAAHLWRPARSIDNTMVQRGSGFCGLRLANRQSWLYAREGRGWGVGRVATIATLTSGSHCHPRIWKKPPRTWIAANAQRHCWICCQLPLPAGQPFSASFTPEVAKTRTALPDEQTSHHAFSLLCRGLCSCPHTTRKTRREGEDQDRTQGCKSSKKSRRAE
jgi:hypothetical protein